MNSRERDSCSLVLKVRTKRKSMDADENKQKRSIMTTNLGSQIKEDHLTCSVCFNHFRKPKALPCLHTFCESCLQDYVVSRNYESQGKFPCPTCRLEISIPAQGGVQSFPDNHLVASLSDTIDQLQPLKPVPKPRRSLGQTGGGVNSVSASGSQSSTSESAMRKAAEAMAVDNFSSRSRSNNIETECCTGPDGFEIVETRAPPYNDEAQLPPPYSSVADTHPDDGPIRGKVCANDTEQDWMVVPGQPGATSGNFNHQNLPYPGISANTGTPNLQNPYGRQTHTTPHPGPQSVANYPPTPIGWSVNALGPSPQPGVGIASSQQPNLNRNQSPVNVSSQGQISSTHRSSSPLYPSVPMDASYDTACSQMLLLRFGKQGSTARDFIKPLGLVVSREGHFIVSDNGGDQNRFLVFNSGGEIMTAFKCGCKVKDIALTQDNELIAAIRKSNSAFRRFTLSGQLKGEYGKFFSFEETCGIAELKNRGIVLTGVTGHCVYVLSDQMKLQTKFGRKGNGDGYFSHPGFVAVDSKNHIIVTDKDNGCIQVFNTEGKFKHRFGSTGKTHGQLEMPMGVCVDTADNIIVADSGNFRVEAFSPRGKYLSSVVKDTWQIGENVRPVNVAMTPSGKVAILLRGPYFAEVRVYSSKHTEIPQDLPAAANFPVNFGPVMSIPQNLGIWPSK